MHLLMEGVVPYELALLLHHVIFCEKLFSLDWLNSSLQGYKYSYLDGRNRPEVIQRAHIENLNIKQSSAAILTLCSVVPIIVGPRVDPADKNWINFLRLIQILFIATAPYCSRESASLLQILIAEHHNEFRRLYPRQSFIPKMHYMVHLPSQMLLYGPTRNHWCMRFEGKHGFFKNKKWRNFKNLPYTPAKHHQKYQSFRQMGDYDSLTSNYLYEGDVVMEGQDIDFVVAYLELVDNYISEYIRC